MHSYSKDWKKCRRCGTLSNDVEEGKCSNEERCIKFAARRSDVEFELRVAKERAKTRGGERND